VDFRLAPWPTFKPMFSIHFTVRDRGDSIQLHFLLLIQEGERGGNYMTIQGTGRNIIRLGL